MSIFNFRYKLRLCQEGFLLLESLIAIGFLACSMLCLGSWYGEYMHMQAQIEHRMVMLAEALSCIGQIEAGRHSDAAQVHWNGYEIAVTRQEDESMRDVVWVRVSVSSVHSQQKVELLTGVRRA